MAPTSEKPVPVLMPLFSPDMEKGNLAKWLKKEGEPIKAGEIIAEIETDKATMELEATDEGTLGKILIPEGTPDVAVNTPIATILHGTARDEVVPEKEFWELLNEEVASQLRASKLDTPEKHAAYIRARIGHI